MTQAPPVTFKIPTKIPQLGRGKAVRPAERAETGRPATGRVLASGTGRAATRGGTEVVELEHGIPVYPARAAELRRRHPSQPWPPLRSAEPEPIAQSQPCDKVIAPTADIEEIARRATDLAARHREFTATLAERQGLMISL
jgi:hypothetical protein